MIDLTKCVCVFTITQFIVANPEIWHHYYPPYEGKSFIVCFLILSHLYETFSPWVLLWSLAYKFTTKKI